MLKAQLARAEQEMQAARERRELILTRLNTLTLEENMPVYEVTLKPVEELTIAAIREAVQVIEQMSQCCGQMFDTIGLWLKANNLPASAAMTIYYNEGFARENIDTECAFILPDTTSWKAARQDEVVTVRQLAAVPQMASTIVTDDFYRKVDGLSPAYTSLACWIENNGCRIVGPPRELFYGSVQNGDLTAEVQFPVEKA